MIGYSLDDLLVGKFYRSATKSWKSGIIVEAVRRPYAVAADNCFSVRVRPESGRHDEFWATVFVEVN
jgi:hypothetical protein